MLQSVTVALRNDCEALQNRYGMLREHYGAIVERCITEPIRNVTEALRTLWNITEQLRNVAQRYGTLWNRYGKYPFCPYSTECTRLLHVLAVQCPVQTIAITQPKVRYIHTTHDPPKQHNRCTYTELLRLFPYDKLVRPGVRSL